ncbi:RNA-directed DNA polymerase (Reverse transcriptase) [Trifolium medium]|uniref:RNA-directed DNA polymerase (Reverse transcriptase) n=1 Tax=Trifolium medium TaxID=97028 RepID=A0A392N0E8_9FABA|nr:RNA-directed DNA polymerase (Reverse transcriptase) [Trifolium medium]
MNSACLMKMGREMRVGKSSLWCHVLQGKYGRGRLERGNIITRPSDSFIWKGVVKSWVNISGFEMWTVGDGKIVKAWTISGLGRILSLKSILRGYQQRLVVGHYMIWWTILAIGK